MTKPKVMAPYVFHEDKSSPQEIFVNPTELLSGQGGSKASSPQDLILEKEKSIAKLGEELKGKESKMAELEQFKISMERMQKQKDKMIAKLKEELSSKDNEIADLQLEIVDEKAKQEHKDDVIAKLKEDLELKDIESVENESTNETIAKIREELAELQKDAKHVAALREELKSKNRKMADLERVKAAAEASEQDKDHIIAKLRAKLNEREDKVSINQDKEKTIAKLNEQLLEKTEELADLQTGLETQVHMVMELERQYQAEIDEYKSMVDSNQKVIDDIGQRLGQDSREKQEMKEELAYVKEHCENLTTQLKREEELNSAYQELYVEVGKDGSKPKTSQQVDSMLQNHERLVRDFAKKNREMQQARQEVLEKERTCNRMHAEMEEIESKIEDLHKDVDLMRRNCHQKDKEMAKYQERIQMLEKSLDEADGTSHLMKELKEKEELLEKTIKERNVVLSKATQLSIGMASLREKSDALREKLQYQNNIIERILGKSPTSAAGPGMSRERRKAGAGSAATVCGGENGQVTPKAKENKPPPTIAVNRKFTSTASINRQTPKTPKTPTRTDSGSSTSLAVLRGAAQARLGSFFGRGAATPDTEEANIMPPSSEQGADPVFY